MEVTEAMAERIYKYAEKMPRFDDGLMSLKVTLGVDRDVQSAEVLAKARHTTFVAKDESHDMYESIRNAFEKMETQIARHNDKVKNRRVPEHGERTAQTEGETE
jgi:putative sigma-54 modulation protein